MIVLQRETEAESFLVGLDAIYDRGPELLPADEIQARKIWALKMVQRMERGDVEGNYRRVWLLSALLEDYFHIRSLWYQGPKKSLKWLNEFDAPVYTAFCVALAPGASNAAVLSLAHLVVDSEKSLH